MNRMKKFWTPLILLCFCLIIHFFGLDAERVERIYTGTFYRYLGSLLRRVFGIFSFSVGDLLYGFFVFWLLWKIYVFIKNSIQNNWRFNKEAVLKHLRRFFNYVCCLYIIFSVLWGLNYDRIGIAGQFGLKIKKYEKRELVQLNEVLLEKVNDSKEALLRNEIIYPDNRRLFERVTNAYGAAKKKYSFIHYNSPSVKSSMWGWFGNYAGFTGYYNPFTGEAQVNTTVPEFLQPFITCHEVAHQLGYAKEMEANFVGFLAATASSDSLLHYSAYLDMFLYANRNLYTIDSSSSILYRNKLSESIKQDIITWKQFNKNHVSFLDPMVSWVYDKFLLSNNQPKGMLSYSEVVGYLIAYYCIN